MALYYLVYISSAVNLMKEAELTALLDQARENNVRNNITGMLLYKDGAFMQAMEGEEADVLALHGKILQDSRHKNVITLLKGALANRHFGEWQMAFTNVSSLDETQRKGFSPFLNEPFNEDYFGSQPAKALKLLLSFKKSYDR